jgi:hypothetical protein
MKLRGDDAPTRDDGVTGANASVEVAKRQIAERMARMHFMVIEVYGEYELLVLLGYDNDVG